MKSLCSFSRVCKLNIQVLGCVQLDISWDAPRPILQSFARRTSFASFVRIYYHTGDKISEVANFLRRFETSSSRAHAVSTLQTLLQQTFSRSFDFVRSEQGPIYSRTGGGEGKYLHIGKFLFIHLLLCERTLYVEQVHFVFELCRPLTRWQGLITNEFA